MKKLLFHCAFAALLTQACSTPDEPATQERHVADTARSVPATPEEGMVHLHSLENSGLRFDGVYTHISGGIYYYMRFFPRGNVVLIAGRKEDNGQLDLRSLLREDAQSGVNNLHNVPVVQRNDSLFFTTMAPRGAITYAGVAEGDTVRFLKHSRVTHKQAVLAYGFEPY